MLADGYIAGASTLVAGPSGSGKTLLCLHFLMAGARAGQPGLIATMQENPIQLERTLNGYDWTLKEPGIELLYRTPVDLYLDQWVYDLLATIDRTGAQRVMIDSLGDLRATAGDELRFREYMYSLLQRCAHKGVSVMMTQEVPELFGVTRLSEYGISHLSDNVVLLQFLLGESQVRRAITVIKTRSSGHDSLIRQFDITSDGFVLGEHLLPIPKPVVAPNTPGPVGRSVSVGFPTFIDATLPSSPTLSAGAISAARTCPEGPEISTVPTLLPKEASG